MQLTQATPFAEALAKFDARTIVRAGLDSEAWANVPLALRERAFFSATVESARFLQRAQDALSDFLRSHREDPGNPASPLKTGSRSTFVKQLQDLALREGLGPLDPQDAGTLRDVRSESRLALIFDTQARQAHDFGYWQQGQHPDILNEFPAQRFIREIPVKEPRDTHVHHEGEVRLKSDLPFWTALNRDFGVPWGPWGWGCGHAVEDVDRDEAQRLGLIKPGEQATPIQADFNHNLQASVQNLSKELQEQLSNAFGPQITIQDGAARWTPQPPNSTPATPPPARPTPAAIRKSPVSKALQITRRNPAPIRQALDLIDLVHDDGILPPIPITRLFSDTPEHITGKFREFDGKPLSIQLRDAPGQQLTLFHEVGHFIDHQALGAQGQFASISHPVLDPWRKAVRASTLHRKLSIIVAMGNRYSRHAGYLLGPQELWARSYSQWVATRLLALNTGDSAARAAIQAQLAHLQLSPMGGHWPNDDFSPIAAALDTLFKDKGWI